MKQRQRHISLQTLDCTPKNKRRCSNNSVEALKAHLDGLGAAASERHKALSPILARDFKRGTASLALIDHLHIPKFFNFSSYDRMSGQVSLEQILAKSTSKTLDRNDQVFIAFLSMVGTTLEDMAKLISSSR